VNFAPSCTFRVCFLSSTTTNSLSMLFCSASCHFILWCPNVFLTPSSPSLSLHSVWSDRTSSTPVLGNRQNYVACVYVLRAARRKVLNWLTWIELPETAIFHFDKLNLTNGVAVGLFLTVGLLGNGSGTFWQWDCFW